jgi:hypothetical protein
MPRQSYRLTSDICSDPRNLRIVFPTSYLPDNLWPLARIAASKGTHLEHIVMFYGGKAKIAPIILTDEKKDFSAGSDRGLGRIF